MYKIKINSKTHQKCQNEKTHQKGKIECFIARSNVHHFEHGGLRLALSGQRTLKPANRQQRALQNRIPFAENINPLFGNCFDNNRGT